MPAAQHDFTATEIKAGILVLVSIVILVGFVAAIRGCRPHDDSAKQYCATFTDISGLNKGADVRFGGVRVGKVTAIEPDAEDRSRICVIAEVEGDIPVNEGSVASIEQVTMTAEKHLEITTGGADQPLHESGDTLRSSPSHGLLDLPDLEGVVDRLETLLDGLNVLVGTEETGDAASDVVGLTEIFASLDVTLEEISGVARAVNGVIGENRAGLGEIVKRLSALEEAATDLMTQLNDVVTENRGPLHESVGNLQQLTAEMSARVSELAATLQATLLYLQEVGANSSDLLDDQRPTIEEILINLQDTTRNLREFSQILADQPDALIRGKGKQGRGNGEKK
jgi:phospholipid/cholesterol/gamma-HCH transport system substrate-binding protein